MLCWIDDDICFMNWRERNVLKLLWFLEERTCGEKNGALEAAEWREGKKVGNTWKTHGKNIEL
jgi:hypothetical protein